jgi:hypothetical protein
LATCDNTDDMLAIDPRPGNATSNCAADNIALLERAVSRLPGRYRRRMLVRLDGAGSPTSCSKTSPPAAGSGAGTGSSRWVGRAPTPSSTPSSACAAAPGPRGSTRTATSYDTFVADLTGLLDLRRWHDKIPGLRIIVRDEPLHPRYRKRATEREKQLGRRYQLIAINAKVGQIAWLDARHRWLV